MEEASSDVSSYFLPILCADAALVDCRYCEKNRLSKLPLYRQGKGPPKAPPRRRKIRRGNLRGTKIMKIGGRQFL